MITETHNDLTNKGQNSKSTLFKKPLTIKEALKAGLFSSTLLALIVFACVSIFTPLWPWGCAVWYVLASAAFTFYYYDYSQPAEDENSEL